MFILTFTFLTGLAVAVFAYFWVNILTFANGPARNFIKKHLGPLHSNLFGEFLSFLDNVITPLNGVLKNITKAGVKAALAAAKWTVEKLKEALTGVEENLKKWETTYVKNGSKVTRTTVTIVPLNDTEGTQQTVETEVDWVELPKAVRDAMIAKQQTTAKAEDKKIVVETAKTALQLIDPMEQS
jgi:hypothetical protein